MKESFGNAFVFGLFITFAFLLVFMLFAAVNYSRANKIKNKILNTIATYAETNSVVDAHGSVEPVDVYAIEDLVHEELARIGYRANTGGWNQNSCPEKCANKDGGNCVDSINQQSDYHYCVYAFPTERGYYYGVTTFMYFDIPVIGARLEFPIYGETRVIYDLGAK